MTRVLEWGGGFSRPEPLQWGARVPYVWASLVFWWDRKLFYQKVQTKYVILKRWIRFSSTQSLSRVRVCDPMNRSTQGLPVHHKLPEFTQTHVNRVGDALQPSHPNKVKDASRNPSSTFTESRLRQALWAVPEDVGASWPVLWGRSFLLASQPAFLPQGVTERTSAITSVGLSGLSGCVTQNPFPAGSEADNHTILRLGLPPPSPHRLCGLS